MRVIGINDFTNVVQAVASKRSQVNGFNFGGNAVVALAPDCCALMSQGNTDLHVIGGGMYSNWDDPTCSFKKQTCAGVTNIDADTSGTQGTITMVGGASINTGCPPDAGLAPAGGTQIDFPPPYEEPDPPDVCSEALVNIQGNPSSITLAPGHYAQMPPKNNMKNITLQPGVYCIDSEQVAKIARRLRRDRHVAPVVGPRAACDDRLRIGPRPRQQLDGIQAHGDDEIAADRTNGSSGAACVKTPANEGGPAGTTPLAL